MYRIAGFAWNGNIALDEIGLVGAGSVDRGGNGAGCRGLGARGEVGDTTEEGTQPANGELYCCVSIVESVRIVDGRLS